MDIFTRFNRKRVDDRQIDMLIGLSKGLLADGKVNQSEAEFLHNWLAQNKQASNNPIVVNLLARVSVMLEDGILDSEESEELLGLLQKIAGEPSEMGEIAKTTTLPLCNPFPEVTFENHAFVFTGTCAFGTRKQCQEATAKLGGVNAKGITRSVNYVVLGSYVTDSWAHETFGRKIEKAVEYRAKGVPLAIISEEHWANSGNLTE